MGRTDFIGSGYNRRLMYKLGCAAIFASPLFSSSALSAGMRENPLTPREIFQRSVSDQTGEIFLLAKRGNFMLEDRDFKDDNLIASHVREKPQAGAKVRKLPPHPLSMHAYAWDYDLEIPLGFYDPTGRFFKAGKYKALAVQQDIAPTLAAVLGISAPPKARGRVLQEALVDKQIVKRVQKGEVKPPKAILVFVQDMMGQMYLRAHPDRSQSIRSLLDKSAEFLNAQVAHVDVETAPGHSAVGTGGYPKDTAVPTNNYFHTGLWQKLPAFTLPLGGKEMREGYPGFFAAPALADVWQKSAASKGAQPKILALAAAPRAAMAMGGHGSMFAKNEKTHVMFYDEDGETPGQYTTDTAYYELPSAVKGKKIDPWLSKFMKETTGSEDGAWFGHTFRKDNGKINYKMLKNSPVQTIFETDLFIESIKELNIGSDETTDLVFLNTKATDYCGHAFGFESEECGDVLKVTGQSIERVVAAVAEATGGDYLVVLTADHGAAPLPEISGGIRAKRSDLLAAINQKFDSIANGLDVALSVTSSQLYINVPELQLNGGNMRDVVTFVKNWEVPFTSPGNALADEWIAKGKPTKVKFFEDVVLASDLQSTGNVAPSKASSKPKPKL